MAPKPFRELLPLLRAQRGWSREALSHRAFQADEEGTSVAQITAIERGARYPSAKTIAALAAALEIPPETFAEYRLAKAREQLDERVVGLEQAVENLSRLPEDLRGAGGVPPMTFDEALEVVDSAAAEDRRAHTPPRRAKAAGGRGRA